MKIGLIKESKTPPDSRVPLTPAQAAQIDSNPAFQMVVAPSPKRCYSDQEYLDAGLDLHADLSDCEVLLGVKEVVLEALIPDKTYFFFSHTIKKQTYNRDLLLEILRKNIRMIDYEVLTNSKGQRLIAFGRFAGMVGAHNALWTYGQRTGSFHLKRMKDCFDYAEAKALYQTIQWPEVKIVLTGTGRVGNGAAEVLTDMGIRKVTPEEFLNQSFSEAVFTQLDCQDYAKHSAGRPFELSHFFAEPQEYESIFQPYQETADIFINGIYWDNQAPAFFTPAAMNQPDFSIQVIADVTCDIAPVSSIPSTLRPSTIADPVFGYNPETGTEQAAFTPGGIDMMTIDNLPNEMPRDASEAFGDQFLTHIFPELAKDHSEILERATIALDGKLGPHFQYLQDFVDGE